MKKCILLAVVVVAVVAVVVWKVLDKNKYRFRG